MSVQNGITASLERQIVEGALGAGAALPSVRGLARERGVSPGTVAAAYADLRRRGLVVSRPRSGMRVADRSAAVFAGPAPVPEGVRDLANGNPDPVLLPDVVGALRAVESVPRLYGSDAVDASLRSVVVGALANDGIEGREMCVVHGAMDGVERALAAWLVPGDAVAVEDPGFPAVFAVVRALGLVPAPIVERRVPDGVRAVVVSPRGQNPTGAVLSGLHVPPGVLVIEDDHLGAVAGAPLRTQTAGRERWVHVRSVSKWLGPDLRLAVMAGDAATVARVAGRQALGPGWVSTLVQRAVAALWVDADAERAAAVYAQRRQALIDALADRGIAARGESGLNVWVPVPDEQAVTAGLLARGWAVTPGAAFRIDSPPAVRVTTAALEPPEARRLAADVAAVLAPPARTRAA